VSAPTYRRAARILVTDQSKRVLLFLTEPGPGRLVWITPGGGLEDGESWDDAAARELREEVGLEAEDLGGAVWMRRHVFTWRGKVYEQDERYFWLSISEEDVQPPPATDAEPWIELRWWTAQEIRAAEGIFAPRDFADLLESLFRDGRSPEPIDTGI
jgi:ADP-ribose pyrophosphatase YjhB (NUDIX family)